MSRRLALAWLLVCLTGWSARAQIPYGKDLLPTRSALARLGLERGWMAVVPLLTHERVLEVSLADSMVFAHTNMANFHVFDGETGQRLWSANLGRPTAAAVPASVNSYSVFVTNANYLYSLDRRTGRLIWSTQLEGLPTSPTTCDEHQVVLGLQGGKAVAYFAKLHKVAILTEKGTKEVVSPTPLLAWNWQTNGAIVSRPIQAGPATAFASLDGKVYVAKTETQTMLYRFATGGQVVAPLAGYGARTLLIPATDQNLYALDVWTAQLAWTYSAGSPINQEPLVAGDDVYIVNGSGILSSIDAKTGDPRWSTQTHGGRLLAVSPSRLYLESADEDLFIVDRITGKMLADPRATLYRAGVNLREYDLAPTNRLNDRLYFATKSGMVICLRELGQTTARLLHDPKTPTLGYIPPEGLKLSPFGAPEPSEKEPAPAEKMEDAAAPDDKKKEDAAAPDDKKKEDAAAPDDKKKEDAAPDEKMKKEDK